MRSALNLPRRRQLMLKRALDVALLLAFLLPALLLGIGGALAMKLTSRGPVLVSHMRDGRGGRPFRIYKLRTMHAHLCDASGLHQPIEDTRVTPVGRWLRKFNIDELPQFYNIVRGDMSFVGPRPHPVGTLACGVPLDQLAPLFHLRESVRPGLTGLAQSYNLRGPTDDPALIQARIAHDLAYISNISVRGDLAILWRTALLVLKSLFR